MAAPKQRDANTKKADFRAGRIPKKLAGYKPTKLSHKDRYARWTLKFTRAKVQVIQ